MIDIILNSIDKITVPALTAVFAGYILRRFRRKKKFAHSANIFRDKVLTELKGLYPIPRHLDKDVSDKFRESIPVIESAAAEFRKSIPSGSRSSFDNALKEYCAHCNAITWGECVTYNIVPRKHDEIGPKEIFRQNVNALLSFTKNT